MSIYYTKATNPYLLYSALGQTVVLTFNIHLRTVILLHTAQNTLLQFRCTVRTSRRPLTWKDPPPRSKWKRFALGHHLSHHQTDHQQDRPHVQNSNDHCQTGPIIIRTRNAQTCEKVKAGLKYYSSVLTQFPNKNKGFRKRTTGSGRVLAAFILIHPGSFCSLIWPRVSSGIQNAESYLRFWMKRTLRRKNDFRGQ